MKKYLTITALFSFAMLSSCNYFVKKIILGTPGDKIRRSWNLISFTLNGADSINFIKANRLVDEFHL